MEVGLVRTAVDVMWREANGRGGDTAANGKAARAVRR